MHTFRFKQIHNLVCLEILNHIVNFRHVAQVEKHWSGICSGVM